MGKAVNQTELAEIIGVSDVTLWEWQKEGMPVQEQGVRGTANQYDTKEVIDWCIQRELKRAGKGETQRDREARLRGDLLEIELAQQRGTMVPSDQVKPIWESRVLVAAAFQMSRASRLAAVLEAAPGIEKKREILKAQDAEFLTKLGVDGEAMQVAVEELLMKVSESEAQEFLQRISGYGKQRTDQPAEGGLEGTGSSEEDPAV